MSDPHVCPVCAGRGVDHLPDFEHLPRVTSDCRPFPPGGRLGRCRDCGAVSKANDDEWRRSCAAIYAAYDLYHLSGGAEQMGFNATSGRMRPRSAMILDHVRDLLPRGARPQVLDFGCGNGAMATAISAALPGAVIDGFDLHDGAAARLRRIPGFRDLHVGTLVPPGHGYDLVTMIHSLEHVPDPGATLAQLQGALSADGLLLIQVPDASRNPFDLLVADHRSHFSRVTLERLTAASGMMTVRDTPAVPRELSWLGCRTTGGPAREPSVDGDFAAHHVAWLNALLALVDRDGPEPLGFFGSSIAANWVLARERPRVRFLVDEDPSRHGAVIAGRPVLRPEDVPAPATVVMPFSPDIAGRIAARLTRPGIRYVHP